MCLTLFYFVALVTASSDFAHSKTSSIQFDPLKNHFYQQFMNNDIYITKAKSSLRSPTVHPVENFNATADCQTLRNAMVDLGTDEEAIIDVLTKRSNRQRVEIAERYQVMFEKTLRGALISELSFHFLDTMLALIVPTDVFYASELNRAIKGLGTKEDVLIDIICTLNSTEMKAVHAIYDESYAPLVEDVESDTSGDFRNFLVSLLVTPRDEGNVTDRQQAAADARALYYAGVDQWGTDEAVFYYIFSTRNFNQLRLVFDEYESFASHNIEHAIDEEFSGNARKALWALVAVVRNLQAYYAKRLGESMANLGTRDLNLIRIIVTRCEIDMKDIMREYYAIYGQLLEAHIYDDTSGDYRTSLIQLLGYE